MADRSGPSTVRTPPPCIEFCGAIDLARLTHLDRAARRFIHRHEHLSPGDLVHVGFKMLGNIPDNDFGVLHPVVLSAMPTGCDG